MSPFPGATTASLSSSARRLQETWQPSKTPDAVSHMWRWLTCRNRDDDPRPAACCHWLVGVCTDVRAGDRCGNRTERGDLAAVAPPLGRAARGLHRAA